MHFVLKEQEALLVHFNGRSEMNGDERTSAGDIKFRITTTNKILDQFHGTLKHALCYHDTENPGRDLADKGMEENPDHLPHRRFPSLQMPVRWVDGMTGGTLTVHRGIGGRSDMKIEDIKVNNFAITVKDGGSVEMEFRVQSHPDKKAAGELYDLIQKQTSITIEPPKAEADLASTGADTAAGGAGT